MNRRQWLPRGAEEEVHYDGRRTYYVWPRVESNPADGWKWCAQIDGGVYASGWARTRRAAKLSAVRA